MAKASARKLRLVDPETGEITEAACATCQVKEREIEGFEHTVRSQAGTIGKLRAELRPEEDHELFPAAKRLHDFWRERCKHPKSKFNVERFKEVLPRLREHGEPMCRRAIEGAAYDPFITTRKNGTPHRHDAWHQVFHVDKFEDFANRAPYHLPKPEHVHTLTKALLFLWPLETHEAVDSAQRMLRR